MRTGNTLIHQKGDGQVGNGAQSLINTGTDAFGLALPVEAIVSSVTSLFHDMSREHMKRVMIESQCSVILAQIESAGELERLRLRKEFEKQGLALEKLLELLQREASSGCGCTDMFKMLLKAVLTILNTNPVNQSCYGQGGMPGFDADPAFGNASREDSYCDP